VVGELNVVVGQKGAVVDLYVPVADVAAADVPAADVPVAEQGVAVVDWDYSGVSVLNIHVDVAEPDVPSEQVLAGLAEHNVEVWLADDLFSEYDYLSHPHDWRHFLVHYKLGNVAGYDSWTDY